MYLKTNFYDSIYIIVRIYSLITKMNYLFTYIPSNINDQNEIEKKKIHKPK